MSVTLILCYCFYCVLFCMYLSVYNGHDIIIIATATKNWIHARTYTGRDTYTEHTSRRIYYTTEEHGFVFPFTASQPRDNLSTTSANHVPGYKRYQLSLFRFSLFLRSTSLFPRVIPLFPLLLFSYVLLYCLGPAARASLKLSLFRERAL